MSPSERLRPVKAGKRWQPPPATAVRGWTKLYVDHVTQADTGVDLDFLIGGSGDAPGRAPF